MTLASHFSNVLEFGGLMNIQVIEYEQYIFEAIKNLHKSEQSRSLRYIYLTTMLIRSLHNKCVI